MMRPTLVLVIPLVSLACSGAATPGSAPAPVTPPQATAEAPQRAVPAVRETVTVRDATLDRRIAQLEMRLLERDAQVDELQAKLDESRAEVVRTMAKAQTVASRAEAASAIAEAEVALQSLRAGPAGTSSPLFVQANRLVRQSSEEFDKKNYGGTLYLAEQAKALAGSAPRRAGATSSGRAGEVPFAVPVKLKTTGRGNVREGPGTNYSVAFAAEPGATLTGLAYVDEWIRVMDEGGRTGWIFRNLVSKR